jgi:hypothetical protein
MTHFCPACRKYMTVGQRLGVVLATAAISGALGGAATRHPLGAILAFVVGMKIGGAIDKAIDRACPECGNLLRLVAAGA